MVWFFFPRIKKLFVCAETSVLYVYYSGGIKFKKNSTDVIQTLIVLLVDCNSSEMFCEYEN